MENVNLEKKQRKNGRLEDWKNGKLEKWNTGKMGKIVKDLHNFPIFQLSII